MLAPDYKKNSLSLAGTVAMGTGVMIGAGIFALTGQIAELSGSWFPAAFLAGAVVSAFSAYSYIKVSSRYPSSGGIAMILERAYGKGTITGAAALLMAFSMIINESLVARTFATYTLQLFGGGSGLIVSILSVALVMFAFLMNISGNAVIGGFSKVMATAKVVGILLFAFAALWAAGFAYESGGTGETGSIGFLAAVALAVLAFKGFTTITNSGGEVVNPTRNVGRAIVISLAICLVVFMAVALAVGSALTVPQIAAARDYSLAEAARPVLGQAGLWFTVAVAIIATTSGILASMFAVSRMLTMLTGMKLIPHSHFGMSGSIHRHLLVYTAVAAGLLAAFFDLSQIAALGAIFYLLMDIIIHWGVLRHLRADIGANPAVLLTAIALDAVVLVAFVATKASSNPSIVWIAVAGIAAMFSFEWIYLGRLRRDSELASAHATRGHDPK